MARATIRIILPETDDEEALRVKKEIEKIVEEKTGALVFIDIAPR